MTRRTVRPQRLGLAWVRTVRRPAASAREGRGRGRTPGSEAGRAPGSPGGGRREHLGVPGADTCGLLTPGRGTYGGRRRLLVGAEWTRVPERAGAELGGPREG